MQILQPQGTETDERRIAAILDSYFIEQQAPTTSVVAPISTGTASAQNVYPSPASIVAKYFVLFLFFEAISLPILGGKGTQELSGLGETFK